MGTQVIQKKTNTQQANKKSQVQTSNDWYLLFKITLSPN